MKLTPAMRARLVAELAKMLPNPDACDLCDPVGGCTDAEACRQDLAHDILDVIEREASDA